MAEKIFTADCKHFRDKLLSLKSRNKLCDAVLIVNGNRIPVHANVLASSSEYFEGLFTNTNSKTSEVIFQDVDLEVFQSLIEFFYSGTIKISEKNVKELLKIANHLIMTQMIKKCSEIFEKTLTVENCISIWKFAQYEYLEDLKGAALKVFRSNFEKISQSSDFLSLKYSDIVELLSSEIYVSSENTIYQSIKKWINHDTSRQCHLVDLLDLVKLECSPLDFLISESQKLCNTSSECLHKFIEAMKLANDKGSKKCTRLSTLIAVGDDRRDVSKVLEIYDLNKKDWIEIKFDKCNRRSFTALLFNDKLMLIGGYPSSNVAEYYDLKTDELETLPPMKYVKHQTSAVKFKESVYVIGGKDGENYLPHVEKWDSISKTWSDVAPVITPRCAHAAKVLNEEIYVVGGLSSYFDQLSKVEVYNPLEDKWRLGSSMHEKRVAPGLAVVDGYLYAVGGHNGVEYVNSAEKYDPSIDKWTMIQSVDIGRAWLSAEVLNGQLVNTGGYSSKNRVVSIVEIYDQKNDKWTAMSPLKNVRHRHNIIKIPWDLAEIVLLRSDS